MKEYKVGEIINITKEQAEVFRIKEHEIVVARTAYRAASCLMKAANEEFWKAGEQVFPEILKKYHINYDKEEEIFRILRKKSPLEI